MGNPLDTSALPLVQAREELAALCRAATDAHRTDDACALAVALARVVDQQREGCLTTDECALISRAYDEAFAATGRARAEVIALGERAPFVAYARHVVDEALARAREAIAVLTPLASGALAVHDERAVAAHKTLADRHVELARLAPSGDDGAAAEAIYERALALAASTLPPAHPLRLGLVLNYVRCEYEILLKHKQAATVAKRAFDDAIARLDQLEEAATGESSTELLQALREQLRAWAAADAGAAS